MYDCYFVSDLHLFASRSQADHYRDEIVRAASRAKTFVLGGDIFDFRWSAHRSVADAVEDAVGWLEELATLCPRCHFHFLLGNHDYHQAFIDRLGELKRRLPNFSWHRYYLRLGSNIFLHGDVADRKFTAARLAAARNRCLHHGRRGPFLSRLYDLVVLSHLHRSVPFVRYRHKRVAKRIRAYLDDIRQGPVEGVRNVYFGHTHRAVSNYCHDGLTFHNGGAPIKGVRFRIVRTAPCP
jgi:UDP-2,3-diacylglucosamine pyrophosphatase LpxH